jgi:hypothetical protein
MVGEPVRSDEIFKTETVEEIGDPCYFDIMTHHQMDETGEASKEQSHWLCFTGTTGLAWVFLALYLAVAWSVGDFYPFSTVPMYQGHSTLPAQRLLVVNDAGEIVALEDLANLVCDETPSEALRRCPEGRVVLPDGQTHHAFHIPYLDDEVERKIRESEGASGHNTVRVLRRTWFEGNAPQSVEIQDCLVMSCRGRLR